MTDKCLAQIHLCRVRATRLNPDGTPMPGPNNVYVTDKPMLLTVTPAIIAGEDKDLVGGCDCVIATYKGYDKLKRFDFELDLGVFEPGLMELLLGSTAIMSSSEVIGWHWSNQAFDCSVPAQPNVAFEGWTTGWDQDQQSSEWPYIRYVYPSSYWQIAPFTLQNDFAQPKLTGFSRGNSNWGTGIFHDQPEASLPLGDVFYDTIIPTAECGYQTHSIT